MEGLALDGVAVLAPQDGFPQTTQTASGSGGTAHPGMGPFARQWTFRAWVCWSYVIRGGHTSSVVIAALQARLFGRQAGVEGGDHAQPRSARQIGLWCAVTLADPGDTACDPAVGSPTDFPWKAEARKVLTELKVAPPCAEGC